MSVVTISLIYKQLYRLQKCSVAASYAMTDTMAHMHTDVQFAGSSMKR
ncbi:GGGtGRT protein [Bacteroides sp.]